MPYPYDKDLNEHWRYTGAPVIFSQSMWNRNDRLCRSSGFDSLDDTIGEALAVCAEAVSTCINVRARGDAYIHVLETVYFTITFILQLFPKLADLARTTANSHIYMVLQILASWVNTIVYRCLFSLHVSLRFDVDKLKAKMAFRRLAYVCVSVRILYYSNSVYSSRKYRYDDTTLVSRSLSSLLHDQAYVVLDLYAFPRRYRNAAKLANNSPIVQELIESAKKALTDLWDHLTN